MYAGWVLRTSLWRRRYRLFWRRRAASGIRNQQGRLGNRAIEARISSGAGDAQLRVASAQWSHVMQLRVGVGAAMRGLFARRGERVGGSRCYDKSLNIHAPEPALAKHASAFRFTRGRPRKKSTVSSGAQPSLRRCIAAPHPAAAARISQRCEQRRAACAATPIAPSWPSNDSAAPVAGFALGPAASTTRSPNLCPSPSPEPASRREIFARRDCAEGLWTRRRSALRASWPIPGRPHQHSRQRRKAERLQGRCLQTGRIHTSNAPPCCDLLAAQTQRSSPCSPRVGADTGCQRARFPSMLCQDPASRLTTASTKLAR